MKAGVPHIIKMLENPDSDDCIVGVNAFATLADQRLYFHPNVSILHLTLFLPAALHDSMKPGIAHIVRMLDNDLYSSPLAILIKVVDYRR
jgi:hypothetical protein